LLLVVCLLGVKADKKQYVVELAYSNPKCVGEKYRVEASPAGLCRESFNGKGSMRHICTVEGKVKSEICTDQKCEECKELGIGDPNKCQNTAGDTTSMINICTTNIKGENFFENNGYVSSYFYTGKKCDIEELRDVVMRPLGQCIPFAGGATWEKYSCTDNAVYKDSIDDCKPGVVPGEDPYEHIEHSLGNCKQSLYGETVLDICTTTKETPKVPKQEKDPSWNMKEEVDTQNLDTGLEDEKEKSKHEEL